LLEGKDWSEWVVYTIIRDISVNGEPYIGSRCFVSAPTTSSLVPGTVTYFHPGFLRSNSFLVSPRGWEGGVNVFLFSGSNICNHWG